MAPMGVRAASLPFRTSYLRSADIERQLDAWARAYPDVCRTVVLGTSHEGRPLTMLAIGPEPERARPALWIDGNMHAMELCGSSVALSFAEDLLALHKDGDTLGLPAPVVEHLRGSLAYVLPRMSPDGAEAVLESGRYVRSVPLDDRLDRQTPRWRIADVDGDGLALLMRVRDDSGDFVESKQTPGLMLPRTLDDDGPFYKVYPEGFLEAWDGRHRAASLPSWGFFDDNPTDLNRNFPHTWAPEPEQLGAGLYALSAKESRAVVEATARMPHLMAWVNLHTFGGVYIRPLGNAPDAKMDRGDLEVFRQMARFVDDHVGYATVSGYEEFLYAPDKPLKGDLADYAYHQLGCMSVAVELWDLFTRAGIERKKPFVDTYAMQHKAEIEKIAAWDQAHNQGRTLRPWRKAQHPQLGDVEVGGLDVRVGVWNPPPELLPETCTKNCQVFLRMLALLPRLSVRVERARRGDTSVVDVVVANTGYLATHGLPSAAKVAHSEPLVVQVEPASRVVGPHTRVIGHLDGWGHGLYGGSASWPYQATTGKPTGAVASFVVDGDAPVDIGVGSCRTGFVKVSG